MKKREYLKKYRGTKNAAINNDLAVYQSLTNELSSYITKYKSYYGDELSESIVAMFDITISQTKGSITEEQSNNMDTITDLFLKVNALLDEANLTQKRILEIMSILLKSI